jgi:hypothetical protein
MKSFDLEISNFSCGSSGISGEMTEVENGDYLLRQDVFIMLQAIRCAVNYSDYAERIADILESEGL